MQQLVCRVIWVSSTSWSKWFQESSSVCSTVVPGCGLSTLHLALWRNVFCMDGRVSPHQADGRRRVWRCVGEQFANVSVVNGVVTRGGGQIRLIAGMSYREWKQMHFIDGCVCKLRYCDEILLLLQRDDVLKIFTRLPDAENIPVLALPANSQDMSPLSMHGTLWTDVHNIWQLGTDTVLAKIP